MPSKQTYIAWLTEYDGMPQVQRILVRAWTYEGAKEKAMKALHAKNLLDVTVEIYEQ